MNNTQLGALALCAFALPALAQAQADHHCDATGVEPLLSVADFDGSGTVTGDDLSLLATQLGKEYVAFYDRDADGDLDAQDVVSAAHDLGASSSSLDQQLAELFWATEKYRDQEAALAAGFRPLSQTLTGHGRHYVKLPFLVTPTGLDPNYENIDDDNLSVSEPEGLNYDEDGNLIAVFHYHNIDIKDWMVANQAGDTATIQALFQQSLEMSMMSAMSGGSYPELYDSASATWHQHWGSCWDNLDYARLATEFDTDPFIQQAVFPAECAAVVDPGRAYLPAFNMLHVWLYKLNPCGTFAGIHPEASPDFPDETFERDLSVWFSAMGLPDPYEGMSH